MGKEIRMQRNELVWQSRVVYWKEEDWNNLKKWVAGQAEKAQDRPKDNWYKQYIIVNAIIQNMTWDEAVEEYRKWDENEEDALYWDDHYYNGNPYKQYFGDWLLEQIREDCYNADVDNEEYADDSDENIDILGDDDEDAD